MSRNKDIWDTKENAEAYDKYAITFPMYHQTSRDLVAISGIESGMVVVDLAAGTGVTTQAIIDKTGGDVRVIVVDQAGEMLNKAKEKFAGKDVEFIVSEAEELDKAISDPVDAVICNSAFWQMRPKLVFAQVSTILKEGGVFAFSLPDQFFPGLYTVESLTLWGKEVGLTLDKESIKTYEKTPDEILSFREIPVMNRGVKSEEVAGGTSQHQWTYFVFKK